MAALEPHFPALLPGAAQISPPHFSKTCLYTTQLHPTVPISFCQVTKQPKWSGCSEGSFWCGPGPLCIRSQLPARLGLGCSRPGSAGAAHLCSSRSRTLLQANLLPADYLGSTARPLAHSVVTISHVDKGRSQDSGPLGIRLTAREDQWTECGDSQEGPEQVLKGEE